MLIAGALAAGAAAIGTGPMALAGPPPAPPNFGPNVLILKLLCVKQRAPTPLGEP
jgi:hypothetical protein